VTEYPERVVIISGMSGAGKSTALRCFEDMGYFCVDNIPPQIIETFLKLLAQSGVNPPGVAFVCDIRSGALFDDFQKVWEDLKGKSGSLRLIFIDGDDSVILRRFKEHRRQHPLAQGGVSNEAAIAQERERLEPLKELASETIDTSGLTPRQLSEALRQLFIAGDRISLTSITLLSFGYKYGMPQDADFVFDSRFLPNPFYIEEFKPLTGNDQPVYDYVMNSGQAQWFAGRIKEIAEGTLPGFEQVQKINLMVAVGCTGGQHRSVALVNWLKQHLESAGHRVLTIHRDIGKL
jgi:UPF0042 nucleotide-binding protein